MSKLSRAWDSITERAGNTARKAGQFYLDNRDLIDAATIAYPLAQSAARSPVVTKVACKVALGGLALKAAPVFAAGAALYYGPDLVKKAKNFMAQGETVKKASKGDFKSIRGLADTLAERAAASGKTKAPAESEEPKAPSVPPVANDDRATQGPQGPGQ